MMNSDYYREGEKKLKIGRKLAKENYIEELNIFARQLLLVKKVIPMIYDEILKYFLEENLFVR